MKKLLLLSIILCMLSLLNACMQDIFNCPQWLIILEKMVMSTIFLGVGLKNYLNNPIKKNRNFIIIFLFFWLADLALPIHFITGCLLFAIGHILLIIKNLNKVHMEWDHIFGLFLCLCFTIVICFILPVSLSTALRIVGGIYLFLLLFLLYSSDYTNNIMRIGTILFVCSDIFLVFNKTIGPSFIRHFFNLALYYEAVLWFTFAMKQKKIKSNISN